MYQNEVEATELTENEKHLLELLRHKVQRARNRCVIVQVHYHLGRAVLIREVGEKETLDV